MSAVCSPPARLEQRQTLPAGFYEVHPHAGRWAVTHALPGMHGSWAVVLDCATQAAAEKEASRMNKERLA